MKIDESFQIDGPIDMVWDHVRDPAFVASCMPGVELTEQTPDGSYLGRINIQFGPTSASFTGRADFTINDEAHAADISARGTDKKGSTKAAAAVHVALLPGEETTTISVSGSIDVFGPLSSFASTGGTHVTRALLADFAACVGARLAPAGGGEPSGTEATSVSGFGLIWRSIVSAIGSWWRSLRNR